VRLVEAANNQIQQGRDKVTVLYKAGRTQDIISVIMQSDEKYSDNLKQFAHNFRADYNSLYELWAFVRYNITYKRDPKDQERIKSPSQLWKVRNTEGGDCKSMSLFIGSVLKNIGVPYQYKYVAWDFNNDYQHVYIVANLNGRKVFLDAVHGQFDDEEAYAHDVCYSPTTGGKATCIAGMPQTTSLVQTIFTAVSVIGAAVTLKKFFFD